MTMHSPELFRPDQIAHINGLVANARKAERALFVDKLWLAICIIAFFFIALVDTAYLLELMTLLLSDNNIPTMTSYLLATTGLVIIIGLHAFLSKHSSPRYEGFLRRAALLGVAMFMIGVGLFLAGMFYKFGAKSLITSDLNDAVAGFLGNAIQTHSPTYVTIFENDILPAFPIIFTLGAGLVFVVSIFAGHVIAGAIRGLIEKISRVRVISKEVKEKLGEIHKCEKQYAEIRCKLKRETTTTPAERYQRHADTIIIRCIDALRAAEKVLAARKLNPDQDETDIIIADHRGMSRALWQIDIEELERRVLTLRDLLQAKNIMKICTENEA